MNYDGKFANCYEPSDNIEKYMTWDRTIVEKNIKTAIPSNVIISRNILKKQPSGTSYAQECHGNMTGGFNSSIYYGKYQKYKNKYLQIKQLS